MPVSTNALHMARRGEQSGLSYMYKATAILELLGRFSP